MTSLKTKLSSTIVAIGVSVATGVGAQAKEAAGAVREGFMGHIVTFASEYSILIGLLIGVLKLLIVVKNFHDAFLKKKKEANEAS